MSAHTCADRWCVRPADIKVGDQNLCAKHWKQNTEWRGHIAEHASDLVAMVFGEDES